MGRAETRSERDFRTSESAIDAQVISDNDNRDEAPGLNRNELTPMTPRVFPLLRNDWSWGKEPWRADACVYMEG